MGIFSNVMTLVIALITIFIVYKALESYGFKGGFAVCYVSTILNSFSSISINPTYIFISSSRMPNSS